MSFDALAVLVGSHPAPAVALPPESDKARVDRRSSTSGIATIADVLDKTKRRRPNRLAPSDALLHHAMGRDPDGSSTELRRPDGGRQAYSSARGGSGCRIASSPVAKGTRSRRIRWRRRSRSDKRQTLARARARSPSRRRRPRAGSSTATCARRACPLPAVDTQTPDGRSLRIRRERDRWAVSIRSSRLGRRYASGSDLGRVIAEVAEADPGEPWIKEMPAELSQGGRQTPAHESPL